LIEHNTVDFSQMHTNKWNCAFSTLNNNDRSTVKLPHCVPRHLKTCQKIVLLITITQLLWKETFTQTEICLQLAFLKLQDKLRMQAVGQWWTFPKLTLDLIHHLISQYWLQCWNRPNTSVYYCAISWWKVCTIWTTNRTGMERDLKCSSSLLDDVTACSHSQPGFPVFIWATCKTIRDLLYRHSKHMHVTTQLILTALLS